MMEEPAQQVFRFLGQLCLIERAIHQLDPAIAGALIELERHVAHAQARVAALLDITLWAAETADQKIPQPFFRAVQQPYGGARDSGYGREGVAFAMEEMSEPRLLVMPLPRAL